VLVDVDAGAGNAAAAQGIGERLLVEGRISVALGASNA